MPFDLTTFLGETIGNTFAKIVGVFKADPTRVLEAQTELAKIQLELQGKLQDAISREVESAASIIRLEAQSQSWLPRNVRPLLLLLWGLAITFNLIVPVIARFWIPNIEPLKLDNWVYELTAIGFSGYVAARSFDKWQMAKNGNGKK